jgi:hypothetical protein
MSPFLRDPRLFSRRAVRNEDKDWRYMLTLLKRASDYFNGEVSLTHQQVQNLAQTLKKVVKEMGKEPAA